MTENRRISQLHPWTDFVLDYVVAHEVAYLVELNHSRRFWKLTEALTGEMAQAKAWLSREGALVHRYG